MPRLVQLCAAWLTLLSFVLSAESVGAVVVAGLAGLDGEHEVAIVEGAAGKQVVLHHGQSATHGTHRHTWATRLATGLADARDATESDHVLAFARLTDFAGKSERSSPAPALSVDVRVCEVTEWLRPAMGIRVRCDLAANSPDGRPPLHLARGTRHLIV